MNKYYFSKASKKPQFVNLNIVHRGFSLIELLVVLVIISLVFGLGYANFRGYQRKQAVMAAGRQIEGDLRMAQEYADQGYKPSGCGGMSGYIFQVNSSPANTYNIIADCGLGANNPKIKANIGLPLGMTLTPATSIKFKVLKEGLEPAAATTFTITSLVENTIVDIKVAVNGVISLGFR